MSTADKNICYPLSFRVVSRAVVINFKAPSVAPDNEDEEDNYSELEAHQFW